MSTLPESSHLPWGFFGVYLLYGFPFMWILRMIVHFDLSLLQISVSCYSSSAETSEYSDQVFQSLTVM
jgi:hypothetical protein